jgi:hypothetical protein
VRMVFLSVHVASGVVALALGPLALLAARRQQRRFGRLRAAYYWSVLVVCASASAVSVLAWTRLWWLVPIAVLSYGLALAGHLGSRHNWPPWIRAHGWGGSYIALVTALLVVSARGESALLEVAAWILPAAIGTPLIVRAHAGPPHAGPGGSEAAIRTAATAESRVDDDRD